MSALRDAARLTILRLMSKTVDQAPAVPDATPVPAPPDTAAQRPDAPRETGGPKGKDPTRYGDWESKGRCIDF